MDVEVEYILCDLNNGLIKRILLIPETAFQYLKNEEIYITKVVCKYGYDYSRNLCTTSSCDFNVDYTLQDCIYSENMDRFLIQDIEWKISGFLFSGKSLLLSVDGDNKKLAAFKLFL